MLPRKQSEMEKDKTPKMLFFCLFMGQVGKGLFRQL
jgi:hypothetical protein